MTPCEVLIIGNIGRVKLSADLTSAMRFYVKLAYRGWS